jgi:lysophospholipase L1-like esterase
MIRKITLNLCAFLVGIALSLVLLEIGLRIYNPITQTVKGDKIVLRVNYDEVRQNTYIPGKPDTRIAGVAPESHIHQNSLGFRGADPPGDFADRLTIVTVGGSTTRSAPQSDDQTWTALLGDSVARCFNRSWINNAGFDGHTSFAHIDLIRNYITKLHPKVALLLIGANELYAPQVESSIRHRVHPFIATVQDAVNELGTRSEVVALALTFYRSFRAWKEGVNWASLEERDATDDDARFAARFAVARDQQPAYAERLRLIVRLLRDDHTVPVLMTQPTVAGPGRDPTTGKELSRLWYGNFFYQVFETYNDTMREVAKSDGVHLIDLARLMPKDTKYYWDPMHYTDAGAKKMSELVAKGLLPYLQQKFPSFAKPDCRPEEVNGRREPASP